MSDVTSPKKTPKSASRALTGPALLSDMKKYHSKVTRSPTSARNFLVRLGVMTADGKTKKLIRE